MSKNAPGEFYRNVAVSSSFDDVLDDDIYYALPDDWYVGLADIVGSTKEVDAGRYKVVNTVGAAVISAQITSMGEKQFPFIFGGDGAAFAIWPEEAERAKQDLANVACWAREEFDIDMRAALVPVSEVRKAGFDVTVARYSTSDDVDYAMFGGGGVSWAEAEMKAGRFAVPPAPAGSRPNLEGLSCRWTPMKAQHGMILSLIVLPEPDASSTQVAKALHEVLAEIEHLDRAGHPIPPGGPVFSLSASGLDIESHTITTGGPKWWIKFKLNIWAVMAWAMMKSGISIGGFDAGHYKVMVGDNADFRKFEDGLKMTIDCDAITRDKLETMLIAAKKKGLIRYGLFAQDEAIMTCIVPSFTSDNHVHFIDGADGGYTKAAEMLKGPA